MLREGYAGIVLEVSLTEGKFRKFSTEDFFDLKLFTGGKGWGAILLWKRLTPGTDPLAPENILAFLTGPLTGTLCPGSRMCIVTKSPLTGTFCDSHVGGHFGAEMKYAGYDAIIIRGRSEKPVYLLIRDDEVELRDAGSLWGLGVFETEDRIRSLNNDFTLRVASIGQAGEKNVRFACICVDRYRQAGRGGTGAVMGSKNLKAIAVKGSGMIRLHDVENFLKFTAEAREALLRNETIQARKRWGTARTVIFASDQDLIPTRNFQEATFEKADLLSAETLEKRFWVKHKACHSCPVNCGKLGIIKKGSYSGTIVEGVEYETLALMGTNCAVEDYKAVAHANMLCDNYGLDTISTGNVIAFIMECYEKGIINKQDMDGLECHFGNPEVLIRLVKKIAFRQGIGNQLAEGIKRLANSMGEKAERIAIEVKGLETPGYDPRSSPGLGLAYVTADRGGCHTRAWPTSYEIAGKTPDGAIIDRFSTEKRASIVKVQQDYGAAVDCLVGCWFVRGVIGKERYVKMLDAATGIKMTVEEFLQLGERVWNLVRMFNVREGFTRKDDTLPWRFLNEPLPSGVAKGRHLTREQLKTMLDEYYMLRGWNRATGTPTKEKLKELGLNFVLPIIGDKGF